MGVLDSLLSVGESILNSTGAITKAVLFVHNRYSSLSSYTQATESHEQKEAKDLMKNILNSASNALVNTEKRYAEWEAETDYKAFEVQYNPSSLSFSTQGAGFIYNYAQGGGILQDRSMNTIESALTVLNCQLIFDDTNIDNAFMKPSLSADLGSVVTAVSTLTSAVTGSEYSVQPQMEAILDLLTRPETRHVLFAWKDMVFRGELTVVENTYTMFNKDGNPIRGTMNITIRQESPSDGDQSYWKTAYNNKFGSSVVTNLF